MSSLNISNDLDSAEADTNWFHVIAISTVVFALLVIGGAIFLHYHEERPILTHFVVPATATATATPAAVPPALMATGDPDVSASMSKEDDDTEYKSNDNSHTIHKDSSDYEYEDTGEVAGFEQDVVDAANKTTTELAVNANAKDFSEFDSGSDSAEVIRAADSMAILQKLEQQQNELMRCYAAKNGSVADLPEASFHTHQQQQLKTPHSAASSRTPLLSEFCLQCLSETATECRSVDCGVSGGVACGIFRISYNYWIDAGRPILQGVDDNKNMSEREVFMQCVSNAFCAARAVQANMQKYARDCNMDGKIDCWDYAELHILGPTGCVRDEMPPVFAMRLNRCLAKYK